MNTFGDHHEFNALSKDIGRILPNGVREEKLREISDYYNDEVDGFLRVGNTPEDAAKFAVAGVKAFGYTRQNMLWLYRPMRAIGYSALIARLRSLTVYLLCTTSVAHNHQFE